MTPTDNHAGVTAEPYRTVMTLRDVPTHCGQTMTPIVYGLPRSDLVERSRSDRGEVELGGCIVNDAMPLFRCSLCGTTRGQLGEDPDRMEDDQWA